MEHVHRVVLFCDISGFMRLVVSLGDRMPGFVQEFYELMGDAVVGHGGTLVKYLGDSILCIFPGGTDVKALRCARRMRDVFAVLVDRHAPGNAARLEVAISSGEIVLGTFGHSSLRLQDVMGEPVAHAAVLNRLPGIVVTAGVREALGNEFQMEEMPALTVKWGGSPLRVFKVLVD